MTGPNGAIGLLQSGVLEMPIYEFSCQNCGSQFETIQSFSSTTSPVCPTCESENVVRQMSKPAIHFKGSGWYINDSKKADKQSANGASENGSAEGDAGQNGKEKPAAESKAEAKNETTKTSDSKSEKSKTSSDS